MTRAHAHARASAELQHRLAKALAHTLTGHSIDRVWRPAEATLLLRITGISPARLLLHLDPALPHVALSTQWPPTPSAPDQTTLRLRQALEGARFADVTLDNQRALRFHLTRGDGPRSLVVQLAGRYPNAAALDPSGAELARLLMARPPTDPDSPPLPAGPLPGEPAHDDPGALLQAWAADRQTALADLANAQRLLALQRAARGHLRKLERAEAAIASDRARVDDAERHRLYGDLLKTALHRVVRGASSVSLPDHSQPDSPEIEVPLDPALDARANLAAHFRFYRRFRDAADAIDARLAAATSRRQAMADLTDELAALTDAPPHPTTDADWDALEGRLRALGWRPPSQPKPSRAKPPPTLPYRRFTALDGSLILVGRSAADNDKLTLRHGRSGDLWLHARDVPGSHVLLRPPPGSQPTSEALLDAATLAAWHSQSRGEPTIDVTWTERRHVGKTRGAPAGRVTVSRGRTLSVRVESERVDRLYLSLEADRASAGKP